MIYTNVCKHCHKVFKSKIKTSCCKECRDQDSDKMLKEGRAEVSVLETRDKWFGVTYQEDKQSVMDSIHDLVKKGVYKEKLFS